MSAGLVGSRNARAVHGWSFGADCVLLRDAADVDRSACDAQVEPASHSGSVAPGARHESAGSQQGREYGTSAGSVVPAGSAKPADTADPADVLAQVCRPNTLAAVNGLTELADLAEAGYGPLVIVDTDLRLGLPGYLDLVDVPGDPTAALLADPFEIEAPPQRLAGVQSATLARVGCDGAAIESSGSSRHQVTDPNRIVAGVLRVSAADRGRAAQLWRDAAKSGVVAQSAPGPPPGLFDLVLLALVRGGMRIAGQPLGYYSWSRRGVVMSGTGGTGWQQRLRSASRLGDGAYSTAVIRPLSRLFTRLSLRLNLAPNWLTMISLLIGVGTAVLIMTGTTWAWIVAAFGLQLALIIDCSDGEVARFTRRLSSFGSWLDGVGDRAKEYLVFAALAAVAAGQHDPSGWLLAMIAMAVVTARHLEDYSYHDRNAAARASVITPRRLDDPSDGRNRRQMLAGPATLQTRRRFWLKKIVHVPIAERYVILSVGLLAGQSAWTLAAAIAVSGFALCWTIGGRLLAALATPNIPAGDVSTPGNRRPTGPNDSGCLPDDSASQVDALDHQLDLGLLARVSGGRWLHGTGVPYLQGTLIMIGLWVVLAGTVWLGPGKTSSLAALASAALGTLVLAVCWKAPLRHRLGWLALPLIWMAEAAVIIAIRGYRDHGPGWDGLIFVVLAVVCYRRYELMYSIRLLGRPRRRSGVLGADGRMLLVAATAVLASWLAAHSESTAQQLTGWGMTLLALATLVEGVSSTVIRWHARPQGDTTGMSEQPQ